MPVNKNGKRLAKVVKRPEQPLAKNKSSLKETKKETVNRHNQLIDIDLFNNWVDNLDSATQESFCSFVSDNNSIIEAYLYSRFLGYEGSIAPCDLWIKQNYKKPDHRKKLLYEIDEMQEDISLAGIPLTPYAKTKKGVKRAAELEALRMKEILPIMEKARQQEFQRDLIGSQMQMAGQLLGNIYPR